MNVRVITLILAWTIGMLAGMSARAAPHVSFASITELDRQSASVLEHLATGDIERASVLARQLARRFPRFALGQFLHAELTSLAALDGTLVGSGAAWSPALIELLLEARARLPATPGSTSGPATPATIASPVPFDVEPPWPFVQIGPDVGNVVLVDLASSRLRSYSARGGVASLVREHYVSSGSAGFDKHREGDRRTPIGLYRITRQLRDVELPELYGAGALVLDYPNAWDHARGRTGSGIWLHGVPRRRPSRAPYSSEGCVTMSNEHLLALVSRLEPSGTLVFLSGSLDPPDDPAPAARAARTDERERYRALFRDWRARRVAGDGNGTGAGAKSFTAAERSALAAFDETHVTIVASTADGRADAADVLIMDLNLDDAGEIGITLWWTRAPRGDGWVLALEHRRVVDS